MRAPGPNDTETSISGSNILPNVINNISRDGHGIEVSPGYNYSWLNNLLIFADAIAGYGGYEEADLYIILLSEKCFILCFRLQSDVALLHR